jgi:hypothetical protein
MKRRYSIINILGFLLLIALVASIMARPAWAQTGYRLPWPSCQWRRVLQGWGESPSHNNTQMWYAYDFNHSESSPVRAARAGTVRFVQSGRTACGGQELANQANYVTIEHSDGTATLYLHLRDVHVSVGQWVARGQTIGTAGRTGWTNCVPHLHFQRQNVGAWITNSQPVYFEEYPGQPLQRNQWYESRNFWPGDPSCPTRAGIGFSGFVGAGAGTAFGKRMLWRRKGIRNLLGMLLAGAVVAGLLSGCRGAPAGEPVGMAVPGTPAVAVGPDVPAVAVVTPSPTPGVNAPLPPPAPKPTPTPRPVTLLPADEVKKVTRGWRLFRDPELGVSFSYPPDYEVRIQGNERWVILSIDRAVQDPNRGEMRETFLSVFIWKQQASHIEGPDSLVKWEAALPPEIDPVGGNLVVVQETLLPQLGKGWIIQWEPLPGNPEVVVQSVAVAGEEQMIWVNLGDLTYEDRQRESSLWPQQMAFLATLEVIR